MGSYGSTLELVLKGHPIGHKNRVSQDRWSLVAGSFTLKCVTVCQKIVVLQDRWSLMAVVSQERFHCIINTTSIQHCTVLHVGECIINTTSFNSDGHGPFLLLFTTWQLCSWCCYHHDQSPLVLVDLTNTTTITYYLVLFNEAKLSNLIQVSVFLADRHHMLFFLSRSWKVVSCDHWTTAWSLGRVVEHLMSDHCLGPGFKSRYNQVWGTLIMFILQVPRS